MKNILVTIFLFFLFFTVYINYSVFKSLRLQRVILSDYKNPIVYSYDKLDSILPMIPNITITGMPLDVYRANYLLSEGRLSETYKIVENANKVNPYLHVGDHLYGKIYFYQNKFDSAYYFSKKAFYGWPKNLDHYNSYVDVLEKLNDTTSLIDAYNYLDPSLKANSNYFKRFFSSFNMIKLSYLITIYPDAKNIVKSDLFNGKWTRVFNFPNNQVILDTTTVYTFLPNNILANKNGDEFIYKLKNDSLFFYFKSNINKPISSFRAVYSESYKTLIFENIEIEKDQFQTQHFKKLN
jgi:tetratricopeptide (TPR) repeat protein